MVSLGNNGYKTSASTYNFFQHGAAHTLHANAERNFVAKPSTELHHLQLAGISGSLQGNYQ